MSERLIAFIRAGLFAFVIGTCASCGGGGGGVGTSTPAPSLPPTAPAKETVREYWRTFGPYFRGVLVTRDSRETWARWEVKDGIAYWGEDGSSVERTTIEICKDGKEYVVLHSFENPKLGHVYPLTDFRTEVSRNGEPWQDITNLCGLKGVVYMPVEVPTSGTLRLRQWAHVHGEREGTSHYASLKPFYWETEWEYGTYEYNPCWLKGAESRQVVVQKELWWDAGDHGKPEGLWARGRGTAVPWQNGQPVDIGRSSFIHRITIAKDAGVGWTVNEPAADLQSVRQLCLAESEWRE